MANGVGFRKMLVLYNALSWIPACAGMTAGASDFALATSDRLGRGRGRGRGKVCLRLKLN